VCPGASSTDEDCSTIYCDSCGGCIGGARLFCLDCLEKEGDTFDTLDLCCSRESQCIEARVTYRQDLKGPHEPYHRLVKLRAAMLLHQFGRTFKLALAAFERVEEFCARITEGLQQSLEEKETNALDASAPESNAAAPSTESVQQGDVPAAADDTEDLTETERTTATTTEMLSKNDQSDDIPASADGSKNEVEAQGKEGKVALECGGASESQPQKGDLPTCGKCDGSLSFPFWYCIFCEGQSRLRYERHYPTTSLTHRAVLLDNLFICDACDSDGVPELTRSSGKHTKEHHLIRCLAPNEGEVDPVPETEQRLMSIESRLDELSGRMEELTGRMGNIEQLLHKIAGTAGSENGAAQV
jgi:hypothetical protein